MIFGERFSAEIPEEKQAKGMVKLLFSFRGSLRTHSKMVSPRGGRVVPPVSPRTALFVRSRFFLGWPTLAFRRAPQPQGASCAISQAVLARVCSSCTSSLRAFVHQINTVTSHGSRLPSSDKHKGNPLHPSKNFLQHTITFEGRLLRAQEFLELPLLP